MKPEEFAICQTIIYADMFDWVLKKDEIWQKLISSQKISKLDFDKSLRKLINTKKIYFNHNYLFLKNRQSRINQRAKYEQIAQQKLEKRLSIIKFLSKLPFIQAIILTGSVAIKNCKKSDDIDLLIITKQNRLWIARLILILITQIIGIRRQPNEKNFSDKLCFNIFLEENDLALKKSQRNLYTASEIIQSQVLFARNQVDQKFYQVNSWVQDFYPNFKISNIKVKSKIKNNRFWNKLNQVLFDLQISFMKSKKTIEIVNFHQAFFHPQDLSTQVIKVFSARKKAFGLV